MTLSSFSMTFHDQGTPCIQVFRTTTVKYYRFRFLTG